MTDILESRAPQPSSEPPPRLTYTSACATERVFSAWLRYTRTMHSRCGLQFTRFCLAIAVLLLACGTRASRSQEAISTAAQSLQRARSVAAGDTRIARLLGAPETFANSITRGRALASGFDASRTNEAYRSDDNAGLSMQLPESAAGLVHVGAGRDTHRQVRFEPLEASPNAHAELVDGLVVYRAGYTDTDVLAASGTTAAELLYLLQSENSPTSFGWKVEIPEGVAKPDLRNDGLWFLDARGDLLVRVAQPYAVDAAGTKRDALLTWNEDSHEMRVTLNSTAGLVYPILLDPTFEAEVWKQVITPRVSANCTMVYDAVRKQVVLFGGAIPPNETWLWDGRDFRRKVAPRGATFVPVNPAGAWDPVRERVVAVGGGETAVFDGVSWTPITTGPQPPFRGQATLTWDDVRKTLVLFGGYSLDTASATVRGDTWRFDGVKWEQVALNSTIPPRHRHIAVWDPVIGKTVVMGGLQTSNSLADTWTFDGTAWTEIIGGPSPSTRFNHAAVWDATRNAIVLYGGTESILVNGVVTKRLLGDTWLFDGTSWKAATPATSPSARTEPALLWDPARGKTVLFGGRLLSDAAAGADTWTFDGTNWVSLTQNPPAPAARSRQAYTWDAERKTIVMYGGESIAQVGGAFGDSWIFDGARWQLALGGPIPTDRSLHAVRVDPVRKNVITFGGTGRGIPFDPNFYPYVYPNDTWRLDGSVWSEVASTLKPPGRALHTLTWDDARNVFVLFGGSTTIYPPRSSYLEPYGDPAITIYGDTWIFDGSQWVQPTLTTKPSAREDHSVVFDAKRKNLVLFGGVTARTKVGSSTVLTYSDETWVWDGAAWKSLTLAIRPPARSRAMVAYDPIREKVVLFGGVGVGDKVLGDTWIFDGAAWTQIGSAGSAGVPVARRYGTFAWDSVRGNLMLFGGDLGARGWLNDTWTFDGTSWKENTTSLKPPPRSQHLLSWDELRAKFILVGGSGPGGDLTATWTYDGANWARADDFGGDAPRLNTEGQLAYDTTNRRHVLFAGKGTGSFTSETWFLYLRGGGCKSGSECGSGYCTEGVCCEAASCRTCETCAGITPGKCAPVINAEDPDTCSAKDQKSCDAKGQCGPGFGATCTDATDCATGFCVDGVCCNEACDGACSACSSAKKEAGLDGRCGAAKLGSNPGDRCVNGALCGSAGTCDRGATCQNDQTALDGQGKASDCGNYRCRAGACPGTCASVADCTSPAVCDGTFRCVLPRITNDSGGGCSTNQMHTTSNNGAALVLVLAALARRLAKERAEA